MPSRRIHSRYSRMLGDLPWQGRPVTLRVQARRFRCLNPACSRQTFAERLVDIAPVAARRTERLGDLQRCLGLPSGAIPAATLLEPLGASALGGEAGTRLAERLAMPASPDTLLRMICATNEKGKAPHTPRVLGVDDWSWRRGHRYGTVLVDLEQNAVVDLLPDRQAETLAVWLRQHPGIEIIARDRAGAYADGARQGAPEAVQVADRWHLLRNLGDTVRGLTDRHDDAVRRAARRVNDDKVTASPSPQPVRPPTAAELASRTSYMRRQARYEEAVRLRAEGISLGRIAAVLGIERKTVRRWLRLGHAPLWKKPPRDGMLAPYQGFLNQRWTEGCRNAAQLWREVVCLGFGGRPGTVSAWVTQRRKQTPAAEMQSSLPLAPAWHPPSSRRIGYMLMAEAETLNEKERAFISHLLSEAPRLAEAISVAKRLHCLLRHKGNETLQDVLAAAKVTLLTDFAASLQRDIKAVQAALALPWTTSPVEGQVNRIKMIKRTMYGRAGFDLLRARVLSAA